MRLSQETCLAAILFLHSSGERRETAVFHAARSGNLPWREAALFAMSTSVKWIFSFTELQKQQINLERGLI